MSVIRHTALGEKNGSPRVFIAVPTYSGKLDSKLVHCLIKSIEKLKSQNIYCELFTLSYHCHVDDARNEIVSKFFDSDCDQLVFIDADVSWSGDCLLRLINHDRDIVAGVYPKRASYDIDFPVLVGSGVSLWADNDGLVEVDGAPTGFMKIKRKVLEKLKDINKDRTYYTKNQKPGDEPNTIIFERKYEDKKRFSGDLGFCNEWRKLGGKIYVDPEMHLTHCGESEFSGSLGDYWREKHGVNDTNKYEKLMRAVINLKNGYCGPKEINHLILGWGGDNYTSSIELLLTCYWTAKSLSEGHVLEAGSGLSTIVMALANPKLHIHCLEHEMLFAVKLKTYLEKYDIKNVTVYCKELKKYEDNHKWYNISGLSDVSYKMVLCDGPPRQLSKREILYSELGDKISDALVIVDDVQDEKVIEPISRWSKENDRTLDILGSGNRKFAISRKRSLHQCQQSVI